MKIKVTDEITKNIPKEYSKGASIMPLEEWDAPSKIRISRTERFKLAAYSVLAGQNKFVRELMEDTKPCFVLEQVNRSYRSRYVIEFRSSLSNRRHLLLCPQSVYLLADSRIRRSICVNWE